MATHNNTNQSGPLGLPSRLILASASPRRCELLLQAGYAFTVETTDIDESTLPGEDAVSVAIRLARTKAEAIRMRDQVVILGADTVVLEPNGELLGKPLDDRDAARMLQLLAGATHQVVTGVCVRTAAQIQVAAALTYVTFQTLSAQNIADYIATGEPSGKAGAYAIQGRAACWIPSIHGDYNNVVGLPLALVGSLLEPRGIFPGSFEAA